MSDDKKPKKDLRARLGRTIAPGTAGTPGAPPPGTDAPLPPPDLGGDIAPPIAAPPAGPSLVPPISAPVVAPFGGDIAPPPFAAPSVAPPAAAAPAPKPRPPADPFAAGPVSAGPQEVRLVIDEKPVDDAEVGRAGRTRMYIAIGLCLVLGVVIGAGAGSMNGRRTLYNVTVRDGHDIYEAVNTSSTTVLDAQRHVDAIVASAAGTGGAAPAVNYTEIEALRGMENPLMAGAFSRKNYGAFTPQTVDDLFLYYNNIQQLWSSFERLAGHTLPEARRSELDRTAAALGEAASAQFGALLQTTEAGPAGQLVFLEPVLEGGNPTNRVLARATRTGPGREFAIWATTNAIGDSPEFVLPISNEGSRGVLTAQAGAFTDFVREIQELKALLDQTVEVQGRLTTSLSEIARLQEVFAL